MADLTVRPDQFPPAAAARIAAKLLNRHSAHEIVEAVEIMVDVLDLLGGDPDIEGDDPDLELTGDERDTAFIEWPSKPGNLRRRGGPELPGGCHEDDEDDDADQGLDEGEPDFSRPPPRYGAGCEISDPGEDEHDRERDDDGV